MLYIHIQLSYYVSGTLVKVQLPPSPSAFLQLLQKDPAERLGNMEETDPIRRHPFFTFDWGALERREIQPPYSPSVVSTQEQTYLTVSLIYLCTVCSFCKQCRPLVKVYGGKLTSCVYYIPCIQLLSLSYPCTHSNRIRTAATLMTISQWKMQRSHPPMSLSSRLWTRMPSLVSPTPTRGSTIDLSMSRKYIYIHTSKGVCCSADAVSVCLLNLCKL